MVIRFNLVAPSPNRLTSLDVVYPEIEDGKPVPGEVLVEKVCQIAKTNPAANVWTSSHIVLTAARVLKKANPKLYVAIHFVEDGKMVYTLVNEDGRMERGPKDIMDDLLSKLL